MIIWYSRVLSDCCMTCMSNKMRILYCFEFICYNSHQKSLGHFQKVIEKHYTLRIFMLAHYRYPLFPYKNVVLLMRHLVLLVMWDFLITTCTSSRKQRGCVTVACRIESAKCPRTFNDYCRLWKNLVHNMFVQGLTF